MIITGTGVAFGLLEEEEKNRSIIIIRSKHREMINNNRLKGHNIGSLLRRCWSIA
jgi:hypothetical protein